MKKLLCAMICLVLTSCIDVDDFGGFWEKGVLDPALEGVWAVNDPNGMPDPNGEKLTITKNGNVYNILMPQKGGADMKSMTARSIGWQKYAYLLVKNESGKGGVIMRYVSNGESVWQYAVTQPDKVVSDWIASKHPEAKQFVLGASEAMASGLKITMLDSAALDILSELPEEYWGITTVYTKNQ